MTQGPNDPGLAGLAALMREHAEAPVDPIADHAGRLALERRMRQEAVGPARFSRPFFLVAATVAAGAALGFVALRPRPVSYEVHGAHSDGPYISAPGSTPIDVAFSDGSSLEADPGARLRVDEARVAGARVLLERGSTKVHVQHHATSAWNFVAGPFDVHVTGTRFELSWDPSAEALDLKLLQGSVEVRGPFAEAPIVVRTGQRFRADLASRSMTVIDGPSAQSADAGKAAKLASTAESVATAAPTEGELGAPHADATPHAEAPSARTPVPSSEGWSSLVARGQFETVVAKAGERGASDCESSCSAGDLKALADAARYTGRSSMAESTLLSLRRRFGTTHEGHSAAFLLGRVEEARGATAAAERWYDTYLRELPSGDLAAEALAGKMRTVFAGEGRAAAEPLATQYLARYPNGVHAQTARGILAGTPHK